MVISGTTGIDFGNTPILNASSAQVQGNQVSPYSGFKNYIINGNFDIWQYKDVGLTYPQTASWYGSDDRWTNDNSGSTKSHSQVACTDTERALFNASYFSRTVVTGVAVANNYVIKTQKIENIYKLAGKTVTLSFWAKANGNKKLGISSEVAYGTGGSPSSELLRAGFQQVLDLTTVWKKFTITVTLPTAVGKTLGTDGAHTSYNRITFWFDAGSTIAPIYIPGMIQQSGTFDIAQVQLEEGSVATPFEQRPYGLELSLCQRYYQLFYMFDNILANQWLRKTVYLTTSMRVMPTVSNVTSIVGGTSYSVTLGTTNNTNSLVFYNSGQTIGGDVVLSGAALAEL